MSKKKETGRKKFIMLATAFGVFIIALVLLFGPQSEVAHNIRFSKALKQQNYQAAKTSMVEMGRCTLSMQGTIDKHLEEFIKLCESENYSNDAWSKYRGFEVFSDQIQRALFDEMDSVTERYFSNALDEETAKTYLYRLGRFDFSDHKYKDCLAQIKYPAEEADETEQTEQPAVTDTALPENGGTSEKTD